MNEPGVGIDTTLVKCPDGCLQRGPLGKQEYAPREYTFVDGTVGRRNYCERCGTELIEA